MDNDLVQSLSFQISQLIEASFFGAQFHQYILWFHPQMFLHYVSLHQYNLSVLELLKVHFVKNLVYPSQLYVLHLVSIHLLLVKPYKGMNSPDNQ